MNTKIVTENVIDIFPSGGVHLIGAAEPPENFYPLANAGRLILRWLSQSRRESTFLGHPSRPFKYLYVDISQTRPDFDEGLDMLGLDPDSINAVTLDELDACTVEEIASKMPQDTKVLVIADAGALIGDKIHSRAEAFKLIRGLQLLAKDRNLTIILILKALDSYYGRERIDGDGLLPRLASTVVILDPGSTPDNLKATIMPLNRRQEMVEVSIR